MLRIPASIFDVGSPGHEEGYCVHGLSTGLPLQKRSHLERSPGYDRFLIEFEEDGRTPSGWSVGWISGSPIHDGSGEPVDMEGNEFLDGSVPDRISRVGTLPASPRPLEVNFLVPGARQEFFGSAIGHPTSLKLVMAGAFYEGT